MFIYRISHLYEQKRKMRLLPFSVVTFLKVYNGAIRNNMEAVVLCEEVITQRHRAGLFDRFRCHAFAHGCHGLRPAIMPLMNYLPVTGDNERDASFPLAGRLHFSFTLPKLWG